MPTTSNFGWTTPADTDLVKDGAAAIRTLGNGIDTSFLDLKGGTTGQVLSKASNTDLDFTWSSVDPLTILDAKGDLITATAADTPARLAVGANNTVLTADSTTATGLKWASIATTGLNTIPTGRSIYARTPSTQYQAQTAMGEDFTWYSPIYLPTCTLDRIAMGTAASFSGTGTIRLGIYNNGAANLPTTVLLDAGTVSATASSTFYEITISQAITAGIYWLAFNQQTLATTRDYAGGNLSNSMTTFMDAPARTTANTNGYYQSGVTGAFATAGTLVSSDSVPWVWVRIS